MARIALIDDDPDIVEATKVLLESKNYEVVSAGNVEEAKHLVATEKLDLIILDVMMEEPDDGFYLAVKFRKAGLKTPIIMLTSISKVTGYNFGVSDAVPIDEFLEKPIMPSLLLDRVAYHLEHSKGE